MRATLWNTDFQRINKQFEDVTKEPLKDGIGILIQATISYDELYGLSLRIIDIDPNFSLGVLAREKQEAIDRLRKEQIFDLNKKLPFPLLPKRIALISVETSKGLADFLKILQNNAWNYRFEFLLFPALLQGDRAVNSILAQIEHIKTRIHEFDAVALIRGGGGDVGLSCYNQYELASAIAKFPIPFLTGIGHATNETVSEMVAYKNAITPSELADFLIQHFHNFSVPVLEAEKTLIKKAEKILDKGKSDLEQSLKQFRFASQNLIRENRMMLDNHARQLKVNTLSMIRQHQESLLQTSRQISILSPENVLKRGFSITYINGKVLMSTSVIQKEQEIITVLADGEISSIVKEINNKGNE
jgi:exodeoxyribonuclease VII large subunit